MSSISAVDPAIVWATSLDSIMSSNPLVLKTTNGGVSWTTMPMATVIPGGYKIGVISAIDANTAWFIASDYSGSPQTLIYKTGNGGLTWTPQMAAFNAGATMAFIHFFDSTNGMAFGGSPGAGGYHGYTTSNGGLNWVKVLPASMPANGGFADEGTGVHTVLGNTIWVAVRGWRVYRSTDRGLTWTVSPQAMPTPVGGHLFLMGLAFTDSTNGLANFAGSLFRTTNAGDSWTPVLFSGTLHKEQIDAIPGSPGSYISVGSYFWPWHAQTPVNDRGSSFSTDHGDTWTTLESSIAHSQAIFLNNATGWASGAGVLHKFAGQPLGTFNRTVSTNGFTIYPNPGTGIFTVSGGQLQGCRLEVYNLVGHKVLQQQSRPYMPTKIDLTGQPNGMYVVRILSKGQATMNRIVLQ